MENCKAYELIDETTTNLRYEIDRCEESINGEIQTLRRLLDCDNRYVSLDKVSEAVKRIEAQRRQIEETRTVLYTLYGIQHHL